MQRTALALMTLICGMALAQEASIQLLRPVAVGDKVNYTGRASIEEVLTQVYDGRAVNRSVNKFSVDMKAVREALTVDDAGRVVKASFQVVYCMRTDNNKMREIVPRDAVLIAEYKDGQEIFTLDGKPLPEDVNESLAILVALGDGGPTTDQVFGVKGKKKVGDRWPVNPEFAAKSFARSDITVRNDKVRGETTLEEISGDHMKVSGFLAFDEMSLSLPEGFTLEEGELNYSFKMKLPLDGALEPVREEKEMLLTITADDPGQEKMKLLSVTRQKAVIQKSAM